MNEKLAEKVKNILTEEGVCDKTSLSFYLSKSDTLKKGDIYFMGLNCGGGGVREQEDGNLDNSIKSILKKDNNDFDAEDWGNTRLQENFKDLMKYLGYCYKSVFGTNLIFRASPDASKSMYDDLSPKHWRVHQEFINIIDPKYFIVFGNGKISPYKFLEKKYGKIGDVNSIYAGHENYKCYSFVSKIENKERLVIGLPHLSRYVFNLEKKEKEDVLPWIKERLADFNSKYSK